jgi:hypothetical protein
MTTLAARIFARQEDADAEFIERFETRIFCLCLVRLSDRLRAQRWTAVLLAECLAQLHAGRGGLPDKDDEALALMVSQHCRERVQAAAVTGDPEPALLRPIDLSSFLRGPAFHRMVLEAMQTPDKRLLYRSITQRMSPDEIGADLHMDPASVPEAAVEAVERALQVLREENAANEARSKARAT